MKKITLLILLIAFQLGVFAQGTRYEAEDAVVSGNIVTDQGWRMTGPSGGGCAWLISEDGSYLEFTVTVASADNYDLIIAYGTQADANQSRLVVNGVEVETLAWTATGAPTTTLTYETSASLNSGVNTIRILHNWGWMGIDYIDVGGAALSVDDFALDAVKMYPNPTNGMLNFDNFREIQNIEVMDLTGKAVKSVKNQNYINIESLDQGIYFVRIGLPNNESVVQKVIKK